MKTAMLLGSYGQTNLGDDLLMWNYLDLLRGLGFQKIYANAVEPGLVPSIIYDSFPELEIIPTYKTSTLGWIRLLRQADAAVYGGGTIYKEMYSSTGRKKHGVTLRMMIFNNLCRTARTPVYNLNIGTGSIKTAAGRRIARLGLNACTHTIFRDSKSYDFAKDNLRLTNAKITSSTDGLFLNRQWSKIWHHQTLPGIDRKKGPVIGLNILSDIPDWIDREKYQKNMRHLVNELLREKYQIIFIPFQHDFSPSNDHHFINKEIVPYIKTKKGWQLLPSTKIDTIVSVIGQCDALIGMRFHSLLLAAATGTPFVALAYDTKCVRFAQETGYRHLIKLEDFNPDKLRHELAIVLRGKKAVTEQLNQIAESQYRKAEECAKIISNFLA